MHAPTCPSAQTPSAQAASARAPTSQSTGSLTTDPIRMGSLGTGSLTPSSLFVFNQPLWDCFMALMYYLLGSVFMEAHREEEEVMIYKMEAHDSGRPSGGEQRKHCSWSCRG